MKPPVVMRLTRGGWYRVQRDTRKVSRAAVSVPPPTLQPVSASLQTSLSASPVVSSVYLGDRFLSAMALQSDGMDASTEFLLSLLVFCKASSAMLSTSASVDAARRHALLFMSLRHPACDVRLAVAEARGVSVFTGLLSQCLASLRHVWPSATTHGGASQPQTHMPLLLGHARIADALILAARRPESVAEAQLLLRRALDTTAVIPEMVLTSLLSLPTAPELLHDVLVHVLDRCLTPGAVDAALFSVLLSALLNNDNFFAPCSGTSGGLVRMDRLIRDVVLRGVALQAQSVGGFDYISVRWTPLMNKWVRVYTKQNEGELLYDDFFLYLLAAVPTADAKIPASFYVRLIGALIDRGQSDALAPDEAAAVGDRLWGKIVTTARRAVRLFGRHPSELRAIWIVLMKAALTLPNRQTEGTARLLDAYLLCAEQDHPVVVDRGAVMQLMRLSAESVLSRPSSTATVLGEDKGRSALQFCDARWVRPLCDFMLAYTSVSFLWLLDGIGIVVSALWTAHGARAREMAARLCEALDAFLQRNGVTGISLANNPTLAAAMEHFQIGERTAFWWRCGCGARLASSSKRCVECLRSSGGGVWWTCASCGHHQGECVAGEAETCTRCHGRHPRLQAALACGYRLCGRCGDVTDADGHCARCHDIDALKSAMVCCVDCGSTHTTNALYCPQCFRPNPRKALRIWLCDTCHHFNLSTWSQCQTCVDGNRSRRHTNALSAAFLPWRCGCGANNHPCRTACAHCTRPHDSQTATATPQSGGQQPGYTCPRCHEWSSSLRSHDAVPLSRDATTSGAVDDVTTLDVHLCEHCDVVHPRDALVLYTSSLARHCLLCGAAVAPDTDHATDGHFVHCGIVQTVNEHYPFRCDCGSSAGPSAATHGSHRTPLQTGYDCQFCGHVRPELRRGGGDTSASTAPLFYVWRCLREVSDDFHVCGAWNYSWRSDCASCHGGRVMSTAECRARGESWQCPLCQHHNRPTDVLLCAECGAGFHQIEPCVTCGSPHLTLACH